MNLNRHIQRLRSALALALMLWCAGAGCVIVSYAHGANMRDAGTARLNAGSAGWGHASGSMGTHNCCKTRHHASSLADHASTSESLADREEIAEVPNSPNAMSCCPLTNASIVVTGRQRIGNEDASVSQGVDTRSAIHNSFTATAVATPRWLPNQNQTYLRGCVFLI